MTAIAIATAIGAAVVLGTQSGMGVTPDSVSYFSMADAFVRDGHPYQTWSSTLSPQHFPPGWPILVGLVSKVTSASLENAARLVNAVAAGAGVLLTYAAIRVPRRQLSEIAAIGTAVIIAANFYYYDAATKALTEPVFLSFVLAALFCAERIARRPGLSTVLAAAASGAAISMRYVGIACLAAVVPLAWRAGPTGRSRLVLGAAAIAIAVAPVTLWYLLAPTQGVSGTTSHLSSSSRAGWDELTFSLRELASLIVGEARSNGPDHWRAISIAVGLATLVLPLVAVILVVRSSTRSRPIRYSGMPARLAGLEPWLLFLAAYLAVVAVQRWSIEREIISRYWLPYLVIALVVAGRGIGLILEGESVTKGAHRVILGASLLALVALQFVHISQIISDIRRDELAAAGLNASVYRHSALITRLQEARPTTVITDNVYLVGFYAPDHEEIALDCQLLDPQELAGRLELTDSGFFALFGKCDDRSLSEIATLSGGVITVEEPGVGVLIEFGRSTAPLGLG